MSDVQGTLDRGVNSDTTASAQAKLIETAIDKLKAFKKVQKDAFKDAPDGAERFNTSLQKLTDKLAEVKREIPIERLQELEKSFEKSIGAADGSSAKLEATSKALKTLKAAIGAGTVEQSRALEVQAELEGQILDINKDINAEKERQTNEIAALQRQALQQEIDLLEAKRDAGQNVEDELAAKREELFQAELDRIEQQKQADIAAKVDVATAEEKAQLRISILKGNQTKREFDEAEKLRKTAEKDEKRAAKEVAKEKKAAQSGSKSLTLGTSSGSGNFGQLENFGFSLGGSPFATDENASFSASFGQSFFGRAAKAGKQAEDLAPTSSFGKAASAGRTAGATAQGQITNNVTNQVTVNVEGRKTRNVATPEDAVREVQKAIVQNQFYDPKAGVSN